MGEVVTCLQWFLQQLPEGQRRLIFSEKKQGEDDSKGGGVINAAMKQLQDKVVFLRHLMANTGSSGQSDMQLSIFSFSNKTLHTELLRIFAKYCATTGTCAARDRALTAHGGMRIVNLLLGTGFRQFLRMVAHPSLADATIALQQARRLRSALHAA